jgi:hypothetical protein
VSLVLRVSMYYYQQLSVLAFKNGARTSIGIILVQYQYGQGPLLVLAFQNGTHTDTGIFALWISTVIGTVHYRYWHSVVPVPVLANMYLDSVPVWVHYITGTGIQLCPYQYWHFCTLVQYQYGQIPLLVLTINDARTSIGIFALWFSISMGTFHYW